MAFALSGDGFFSHMAPVDKWEGLILLLISTIGLYGGGVVFNDYFDAELDAIERPERPIPRGDATRQGALYLGAALLAVGVTAAFAVTDTSGKIAVAIAVLVLAYNSIAKHSAVFGPIVMGLCRGGNLLLGMSVIPAVLGGYWFIGIIPLIYIQGITLISRGEVNSADKKTLYSGVVCYCLVVVFLLCLSFVQAFSFWSFLPFFVLFSGMVLPPAIRAAISKEPVLALKAVKAGVISMIILDAAIAAGFAGWEIGLGILVLLPLSRWMAQYFAVT